MPTTTNPYLTRLYEDEVIIIGPTDGTKTLAESHDVFNGHLDPDFENWGTNVLGSATQKQAVEVYEMKRNANFRTMFGGFRKPRLDLCFQQGQIRRFAKEHRNKLHPNGWATFFLFYTGEENAPFDKEKLFVASVYVSGGRLRAFVHPFDDRSVWDAGSAHRVVIPQLED